jgi:hypothetical protein
VFSLVQIRERTFSAGVGTCGSWDSSPNYFSCLIPSGRKAPQPLYFSSLDWFTRLVKYPAHRAPVLMIDLIAVRVTCHCYTALYSVFSKLVTILHTYVVPQCCVTRLVEHMCVFRSQCCKEQQIVSLCDNTVTFLITLEGKKEKVSQRNKNVFEQCLNQLDLRSEPFMVLRIEPRASCMLGKC